LTCNSPLTTKSAGAERGVAASPAEEAGSDRGASTRILPIFARPSVRRPVTFAGISVICSSSPAPTSGITAIVGGVRANMRFGA